MPWVTLETEERPPMRIYSRKALDRMLIQHKLGLRDLERKPGPKPKLERAKV